MSYDHGAPVLHARKPYKCCEKSFAPLRKAFPISNRCYRLRISSFGRYRCVTKCAPIGNMRLSSAGALPLSARIGSNRVWSGTVRLRGKPNALIGRVGRKSAEGSEAIWGEQLPGPAVATRGLTASASERTFQFRIGGYSNLATV